MTYNDQQNALEPMPKIDLARCFKKGRGSGPPAGRTKRSSRGKSSD
jgi:hypothetical protein